MEISIELVKDLRQRTGAGVIDCKTALQEAKGDVDKVRDFEVAFHRFMESNHPQIGQDIEEKGEIVPETEEALKKAIGEFKQSMPY